MTDGVRLLLAVVVLCVAAPVALAATVVDLLRNHIMRTALLLMPVSGPSHRLFARWVSHYCDGYCWKCGARSPGAGDLGEP